MPDRPLHGRRRGRALRASSAASCRPRTCCATPARPRCKIAEKSPLAVRAIKEAVNRSYETTLREGLLFERRLFHALFATEDQAEGMAAFAEKRSPQFRGK